jgi:ferric-dicitrate binding protein FerR (iron transport regulator)
MLRPVLYSGGQVHADPDAAARRAALPVAGKAPRRRRGLVALALGAVMVLAVGLAP